MKRSCQQHLVGLAFLRQLLSPPKALYRHKVIDLPAAIHKQHYSMHRQKSLLARAAGLVRVMKSYDGVGESQKQKAAVALNNKFRQRRVVSFRVSC